MDISDKLFEEDIKRLLTIDEQSRSRDWAEDYTTGLRLKVVDRLVYVLLFGINCPAIQHWCSELDDWFRTINTITLKPKQNHIKEKDLHKWMCDEWLKQIDFRNCINAAKRKESNFNPIYEVTLKNNYTDLILWYKNILTTCSKGEYCDEFLVNAIYDWYETHEIEA